CAIVHGRRNRFIAGGAEALGHFLDVVGQTEDFLDDNDAALALALRLYMVSVEFEAIAAFHTDHAAIRHRLLPWFIGYLAQSARMSKFRDEREKTGRA